MQVILNGLAVLTVSIIVSTIGNIIGIGGGIILVPFFILYLHLSSIVASGLSLFTIVVSTIGGSYAFAKQKVISYKLLFALIAFILPGIIVGSIVNKFISTQEFKSIFPIWVIAMGIFSLVATKKQLIDTQIENNSNVKHKKIASLTSFIAGFVSGFFGVGIGGIMGTYLVAVEQISPRVAFSTLIMTMTITSLIGFFVHLSTAVGYSSIWLLYAIFLSIGAVIGSQIGAYISKVSNIKALRLYQGWIILSLGVLLLLIDIIN